MMVFTEKNYHCNKQSNKKSIQRRINELLSVREAEFLPGDLNSTGLEIKTVGCS